MTLMATTITAPTETPALRTALAALRAGLRPVPIQAGTKKPMGEGWGRTWTEAELRHTFARQPHSGVGIILGDDGHGNGVIDFEVDNAELAAPVIARLFPDGPPKTLSFLSNNGPHYLLRYSSRLAAYGATRIFGQIDKLTGKVVGNDLYLGCEFRIGTIDPAKPASMQTLIPPSLRDDRNPRQWIGADGTHLTPEAAFEDLTRILDIPESVYADLDRHLAPRTFIVDGPKPTWDADQVKAALLASPDALRSRVQSWGLRFAGCHTTGKGFATCHAIGRVDNNPSAGFNLITGVYNDLGTGERLSLFGLSVALSVFPNFPESVNSLGRELGLPNASGERLGSLGNNTSKPKTSDAMSGGDCSDCSEISYEKMNLEIDGEPEPWEPIWEPETVEAVDFPLDIFPLNLAELCDEAAKSVGCPVDYFAAAAVGLAGAVIGRSVALNVKTSWEVAPNLFIAILGPPGTKKSPALKMMASPLWKIDKDLRSEYREEMKRHKIEKEQDKEIDPPVFRQLTLDDATREAFAKIHSENPRGLCLVKDELTSWVAALNAYRAGKGDDKQFWMSLNTGSLVKVSRKGSVEPIVIPHPCGTVVGCLTPSTLPMMKDGQMDDGWLDRILFAFPDPVPPHAEWDRERQTPQHLIDDWGTAIHRLYSRSMVRMEDDDTERPYYIKMTDDAHKAWGRVYRDHIKEQQHEDFPSCLKGPWSKLEGFTFRFALILSQIRWAYDGTDGSTPNVQGLDILDAAKLTAYFKVHFRRARAELLKCSEDENENATKVLLKIKRDNITEFSLADITDWFRGFSAKDRSHITAWMINHRYIRPQPMPVRDPAKAGRTPTPRFDVNPNYLYEQSEQSEQSRSVKTSEGIGKVLLSLTGYLGAGPARRDDTIGTLKSMGFTPNQVNEAAALLGIVVTGDASSPVWSIPQIGATS